MGWFRRKDDDSQKPPKNAVHYSDAEKELERKSSEDKGKFTYDDDGFVHESEGNTLALKWADIKDIIVYKTDMFTYDIICMTIRWEGGGWNITEEIPGWSRFTEELNKALPNIDPDWEMKVAFPAFATNETLIYHRPE